MKDEAVPIHEILIVLRRNLLLVFLVIGLVASGVTSLAYILPKRFKSKAVLNIQTSYFRNPLLGDLVASAYDPSELTGERASIIRLALNETFLDDLAGEHEIYQYPKNNPLRTVEREYLLKRIEFFSTSPSAFQLSVTASSPQKAYAMTKAVLAQVVNTLIKERRNQLTQIRDAISANIEALGSDLKGDVGLSGLDQEHVRDLEKLEAKLQLLRTQFSDNHPEVLKLKVKVQSLRSVLGGKTGSTGSGLTSKQSTQDVYNDLLKKLNYLNVVLEMEEDRSRISYLAVVEEPAVPSSAIFPKKRIFLLLGLFAGMFVAAVVVAFRELRRGTQLSPARAAKILEVPILGELPVLKNGQKLRLIEGPGPYAIQRQLPG